MRCKNEDGERGRAVTNFVSDKKSISHYKKKFSFDDDKEEAFLTFGFCGSSRVESKSRQFSRMTTDDFQTIIARARL